MFNFSALLIALFSFFLTILVIFKAVKKESATYYFLLSILIIALFFLFNLLWFEIGLIRVYPHFLRTLSPLMFLLGPLFFLGVKHLVFKGYKLKKIDYFHFLPAVLHFLELIPFYLLSFEEKRQIAEIMLAQDLGWMNSASGLIPYNYVNISRFVLMVSYFVLSWKLIFKNGNFQNKKIDLINTGWNGPILLFLGGIQTVLIFQYALNIFYLLSNFYVSIFRDINIALLVFGMVFYLYFVLTKIKVNLGSSHTSVSSDVKKSSASKNDPIIQKSIQGEETPKFLKDELLEFKEKLEYLIFVDQIFLQPNLVVKDLAEALGVSQRAIPELFSEIYGKTYKDMINFCRVNYAKSKIEEEYLKTCTVDSLAEISGFNSRITLYKVFKKEFSLSPTEYWEKIQEGSSL